MSEIPYRLLGRTGLRVSPLTLGTMNLGAFGHTTAADGAALIDRALEAGINLIDTADAYSVGESEQIVGQALRANGRRDEVILATKFFSPAADENINFRGNSRRWIHQSVERSLTRLQTDVIDIYQSHRPTPETDLEETIDALTDLVRAGKIRYFGTSTYPPSSVVEAQHIGRVRGVRPATEQPPYSILARGIETELLPVAQRYRLGVLVWSPLTGGWLSGRYRQNGHTDQDWRRWRNPGRHDLALPENQTKARAVEQLQHVADDAGLTLIQLALGFVLAHPAVSTAIIGPRTVAHLDSQLEAIDVRLDDEVLDAIDAIVAPGVTLSFGDHGYVPPSLSDPRLRRRAQTIS